MDIAIIEARYPYKMSYLDEWISAWKTMASSTQVFNVMKESDVRVLQRTISKFDLIVVLHTLTADTNRWLEELASIFSKRKSPLVLFVGNEYSNPWLSMEKRLQNIARISPEIIATQLTQKAGEFLYSESNSLIVETPHALPQRRHRSSQETNRNIDLGFRGFNYPWYLLDSDRNLIVDEVAEYFLNHEFSVDVSKSERLDKESWYNFLRRCRTTVASEGGSRFVFKTDDVWSEALRFLESFSSKTYLANDFPGVKILRNLPLGMKKSLRAVAKALGKEQGATSMLPPEVLEQVLSRINVDDHQFVSGKALTSRHLDAIYCGTWQILAPGSYNGILTPGLHYSEWNASNPKNVMQEVEDAIFSNKPLMAYEELIIDNSHQKRISKLMETLDTEPKS